MLERKYRLPSFCFKKISQSGWVKKGKFATLKLTQNPKGVPRFGFTIPASYIKKATKRNLLKRRVSEIVRAVLSKIKPGDYLFIIKQEASFEELEQDLKRLLNV